MANISNVISTPVSSDSDPLLETKLYSVISKGRKIIGSQHSLQHACNRLGVSSEGLFLPTTLIDEHPLSDLIPGSCVDVPGDGNCLFSALSVAIGSHATNHAFIRAAICHHLHSVGLQSQFLEAYVPSGPGVRAICCQNVNSYLEVSRMGTDGVFGTCVELFTFAQLAQFDVVVYHSMTSSWFVYEYQGDRNTLDIPSILVRHSTSGNHFDVISNFAKRQISNGYEVEKHNRSLSAHLETLPLPALSIFIPSFVATTSFRQNSPRHNDSADVTVDSSEAVAFSDTTSHSDSQIFGDLECANCLRRSTKYYELFFFVLENVSGQKKKIWAQMSC